MIAQRELVKQAYPSKKWGLKVDKMSDVQVFAILTRLRNQGKIRS
jgi:hypothetical protein